MLGGCVGLEGEIPDAGDVGTDKSGIVQSWY